MVPPRWTVLGALAVACADPSPALDAGPDAGPDAGADAGPDAGADTGPDAGPDGGPDAGPSYVSALPTPAAFAAVANENTVKFLVRTETSTPTAPLLERCIFQDTRRFPWHLQFLQSLPGLGGLSFAQYLDWIMRAPRRRFYGGSLELYPGVPHPATGALGIAAYDLYGEPGETRLADVLALNARLGECAPFVRDLLVFVPTSPDQKWLVDRERAALGAAGVHTLDPALLSDRLGFTVLSPGEAYGVLRLYPEGAPVVDPSPEDVVVASAAPSDLGIVQGLLTREAQSELSHLNLRMRERGAPNAVVPDVYGNPLVRALDGALVHLIVRADGFVLEPARPEDAARWWAEHRPDVPDPEGDLGVRALASLDALRHADALAYGVKAANLGEIARALPPQNRPSGFAIPFSRFVEHVRAHGLEDDIARIAADETLFAEPTRKRAELKRLRDAIKAGAMAPALLAELGAEIRARFGDAAETTKVRFRSSTNVEDLEVLSGAGLYESKTGCLADDLDGDALGPSRCLAEDERAELTARLAARRAELTLHPERAYLVPIIEDLEGDLGEERPVEEAVKKVWASLFLERAYDERAYLGIDQRLAYMGIAVHPTFVLERANAVAITNLGGGAYRLSSQLGDESVVRPADPTAEPEIVSFVRRGDAAVELELVHPSSLSPGGAPIWPDADLRHLQRLLFRLHDHFAAAVYPHRDPLSLDVEIEYTRTGTVVLKQARPYLSRDP